MNRLRDELLALPAFRIGLVVLGVLGFFGLFAEWISAGTSSATSCS